MSLSLPYIAGFVDGEGCIQFSRVRNSLHPRVLIVNTYLPILEEIREAFGGDIKPLALRKEGWKQGWQLRIAWSNAVDFLEKIQPWVLIKREQVHTVFAWDAVRPGRGGRWDQDTLLLLHQRMTWLNRKGEAAGEDPIDAIALSKAREFGAKIPKKGKSKKAK